MAQQKIGNSILSQQHRVRATSSAIRAALSAHAVANIEVDAGEEWHFADGSIICESNNGVFAAHMAAESHH